MLYKFVCPPCAGTMLIFPVFFSNFSICAATASFKTYTLKLEAKIIFYYFIIIIIIKEQQQVLI